ncbi:hypothetical protein AB2762_04120 [Acinetobacter indicus]
MKKLITSFETHQRVPSHHADADIFEKLCASRLDKIKQNSDMKSVVLFLDKFNLLG